MKPSTRPTLLSDFQRLLAALAEQARTPDETGAANLVETLTSFTARLVASDNRQGPAPLAASHLHLRQLGARTSGPGEGAQLVAIVSEGQLTGARVTQGGHHYANPRLLICGDGQGASARLQVKAGGITGLADVQGGAGYKPDSTQLYIVDGPVVVVVGDSIATEQPKGTLAGNNLWDMLRAEIRAHNPHKRFTFFNRAIGATTWLNLAGGIKDHNAPPWHGSTDKSWLDHVRDLQPDLLIVHFGMNDALAFTGTAMRHSLNQVATWQPRPDIVLCTPLLPSKLQGQYTEPQHQLGRDFVAGYVRGTALNKGHGLLDFHRQCSVLREGLDPCNTILARLVDDAPVALPCRFGPAASDWQVELTVPAQPEAWWDDRQFDLLLTPRGLNARQVLRLEVHAGHWRLSFIDICFADEQTVVHHSVDCGAPHSPLQALILRVGVHGVRLQVAINQDLQIDELIPRYGGAYALAIDTKAQVPVALEAGLRVSVWSGHAITNTPSLNDADLFGTTDGPVGGNGVNHPSSIGTAAVFYPVVQAADWHASPLSLGSTRGTSNNIGVNVPEPRARLHLRQRPLRQAVRPAPDAASLLIEDALNPGISVISNPGGTVRLKFGSTDDVSRWTFAYAHAAGQFLEVLSGVPVRVVTPELHDFRLPVRLRTYDLHQLPGPNIGAGTVLFLRLSAAASVPVYSDGSTWRRFSSGDPVIPHTQ